jgi:hypothetical protein
MLYFLIFSIKLFCRSIFLNIKIVIHLQSQSELRRHVEVSHQAQRRISGYATLTQHNFINPLWRNAELKSQPVLAYIHRFEKNFIARLPRSGLGHGAGRYVFEAKSAVTLCNGISSSGCIHAYFSIKPLCRSIFPDVKIGVHLQSQPELRRHVEVSRQAQRRISGYAALAQHNFINTPWRNPEVKSQPVLTDVHRFEKSFIARLPRSGLGHGAGRYVFKSEVTINNLSLLGRRQLVIRVKPNDIKYVV